MSPTVKDTTVYQVQPGDWMAKIADEHGTTVSAIWNHPLNAEHRVKRQSPDVLYPGDLLHIPVPSDVPSEQPPSSQASPPSSLKPGDLLPWPYPPVEPTAAGPTWECPEGLCVCHSPGDHEPRTPHVIVFHDAHGIRMPYARCMIHEQGRLITPEPTSANGLGELAIEIHPATTSLWLEWSPAHLPQGPGYPHHKRYAVTLGSRQEATRRRLANLSFSSQRRLVDNVRDYQRAYGMPPTGNIRHIEEDVRLKHDEGGLTPFVPAPRVMPPSPPEPVVDSLFDRVFALSPTAKHAAEAAPSPSKAKTGSGKQNAQGAAVADTADIYVIVALAPVPQPINPNDITVRLKAVAVSHLATSQADKLVEPSDIIGSPYQVISSEFVAFRFDALPRGHWAALVHIDNVTYSWRGYALGSESVMTIGSPAGLAYVVATVDRQILKVDDPLLELEVEPMKRRRKVLATVFVAFPQSAKKSTAPANMPPYRQGPYKDMSPGLNATHTCAPINTQTMQKAGAPGHEFGFGQRIEIKNSEGKTIGAKPRPAFVQWQPDLAPSVGDCFLGTDSAGFSHHCGIVVRSSPTSGELWLTADGGQPDRTSPFAKKDGVWWRHYGKGSEEAAYVVPRLLHQIDGRVRLGNRFIFPGLTKPGGDHLAGWTDITHPTVKFASEYTKDITHEHFCKMRDRVLEIGPLVNDDIRQCEEEEEAYGE